MSKTFFENINQTKNNENKAERIYIENLPEKFSEEKFKRRNPRAISYSACMIVQTRIFTCKIPPDNGTENQNTN
jgi:thiaminase